MPDQKVMGITRSCSLRIICLNVATWMDIIGDDNNDEDDDNNIDDGEDGHQQLQAR